MPTRAPPARDQTGRGGEPRRTAPGQPAAGQQGRDEQDAEDDVEPDQRVRQPGPRGERVDRRVEGRVPVDGDDQVGDALGQHGQRSHHRQQRSPEPAGVVGASRRLVRSWWRTWWICNGCHAVNGAVGGVPRSLRKPSLRVPRCPASSRCDAGRVTERNVLGGELEPCGTDPMTGFFRDGCCNTGPEDLGSHTICAVVTEEFLAHQRSIGNDLTTPMPDYSFPGLVPGDRWCVTAVNWARAHRDGSGRTGGAGLDQRRRSSSSFRSRRCGSTPSTYRTTSASSTARACLVIAGGCRRRPGAGWQGAGPRADWASSKGRQRRQRAIWAASGAAMNRQTRPSDPGRGPSHRASGRTPSRRARA